MSLVPHNHDFARDQCIDAAFRPVGIPTDWDSVIAGASNLNPEAETLELLAGQPYAHTPENLLKVFRGQARVRIAHRHRRGLPQYAEHTCAECGARRADPVLSRTYYVGHCIHCAEKELLLEGRASAYGDSLRLAFDVSNGTWAIAYASESRDKKSAGIIVTGFASYDDAFIAKNAGDRFASIFNRVCPAGYEVNEEEIVPVGELFRANLPMTPETWRSFLTKNMRSASTEESEPYQREIRKALEDYFSEEK